MRKICKWMTAGMLLAVAVATTGCDMSLKKEKEQRVEAEWDQRKIVTEEKTYKATPGYSALSDNGEKYDEKFIVDRDVPLLVQESEGCFAKISKDRSIIDLPSRDGDVYMTEEKLAELEKDPFETVCYRYEELIEGETEDSFDYRKYSYYAEKYTKINDRDTEMIFSDIDEKNAVYLSEDEFDSLAWRQSLYVTDKNGLVCKKCHQVLESSDHHFYYDLDGMGRYESNGVIKYTLYPVSDEIVELLKPYMY